jgi:hypothetical protein
MNEDALRALIRDAIARAGSGSAAPAFRDAPQFLQIAPHPSSYRYALPPSDGPCIIEPGVACNHCGYCETHGH